MLEAQSGKIMAQKRYVWSTETKKSFITYSLHIVVVVVVQRKANPYCSSVQ